MRSMSIEDHCEREMLCGFCEAWGCDSFMAVLSSVGHPVQ